MVGSGRPGGRAEVDVPRRPRRPDRAGPAIPGGLRRPRRTETRRRERAGRRLLGPAADDLYPDARRASWSCAGSVFRIGIAANQPDRAGRCLSTVGVELDLIATSAAWGGREASTPASDPPGGSPPELGRSSPAEAISYVGPGVVRQRRTSTPAAVAPGSSSATFSSRRGPGPGPMPGWNACRATFADQPT